MQEHGQSRVLAYPDVPEPLPVVCYDNHTHLEIEDGEEGLTVAEHLDLAARANIGGAITVGGDVPSSRWCVHAAEQDARLLAAVAIHPNEAPRYAADGRAALDAAIDEIDAMAAHPRVRAIGETGLDYFRTPDVADQRAQHHSFERHIALAKSHGLAMQIHDRDAHDDVIATLRAQGAPDVTVFHCFSGDADMARIAADEGWYLSFAGTVTFKNAAGLREALAVTPRERILVETDAPFLTPVPFRGRPNAPYLVPLTVRFMAEQLGADLAEFTADVAANTLRAYGPFDGIGVVTA
ncbi:TatD family deoxyribonuclease [Pseudoclavibacter chungangensis]|uniref:TatD family deoxyribonuclease n=1 Tax=Pseudoclavibacter chungangensis TaxID=587635 RepID=A0A7J5BUL7_9MICO|nr:TatD family hydrolase [Pseudoclavibacter chungangensis]KAB1658057.1 TatD family deoxyribonuclease [Pseudoclavibacter chungangensis]